MASMPHITVKVDSSQVQRLIEMADQLRKMSDDLCEMIQRNLQLVESYPDGAKVAEEYLAAKKALSESHLRDASTMSAAAAMHETVGTQPNECPGDDPSAVRKAYQDGVFDGVEAADALKEATADDSPDDPYGIDKSAREHSGLHRVPLEHTGTMKLTREMKLIRDDPDAIQDAP